MPLYRHEPTTGRATPVEVTPFPIEESILEEAEVVEAVNHLLFNCLVEPLGVRAENLHQWLQEATQEKDLDATNWEKVVVLVQAEFREGYLAEYYAW